MEGTEATSRRQRLLIRREELEELKLLARSEQGMLLHTPRPRRPGCEGRLQSSNHVNIMCLESRLESDPTREM